MSIKRPVSEVKASGQLSLLNGPRPSKDSTISDASFVDEVRFKDPDPERIWFGDQSLRAYLASAGLGFGFVLRQLFEAIDWTSFESKYRPGGRPPYAPRLMASIIIYGLIQGVSSLRGLESLCRRDLVCQWLTGGACPDHATIGRFICKHTDDIGEALFEELTQQVLKRIPDVNGELAGDGTLIEASASRYVQVKKEAVEKWAEQADKDCEDWPDDTDRQQEAQHASRCLEAVNERVEGREKARSGKAEDVRINPSDPEAVYHKLKKGRFAFAYLPSIIANRQRLILAQTVHPTAEISVVEGELEQVERVFGSPTRLCLDAGYFSFEILELAQKRELDLLCPAPEQVPGARTPKKFPKHQFIYDSETHTYLCPAQETMIPRGRGYNKRQGQSYQRFDTPACNQGCKLRDQCTEAKRGRRIKRWEFDHLQEIMRHVMSQPRAVEKYAHRQGSVEPVFGEIKYIQGLDRFRRRGLQAVKAEFSLHAMAHNLRRLKVVFERLFSGPATAIYLIWWACLSSRMAPVLNAADSDRHHVKTHKLLPIHLVTT